MSHVYPLNMNNNEIQSDTSKSSYAERETELLAFYTDTLKYYKKSGTRNRIDHYLVNSLVIVLSSLIPILVYAAPQQQLLQALIAAVVAMLASINSFFRFRENWIKNINAAHALQIELTKFKAHVGESYSPPLERQTALDNLMKNFEAIAETALTEWRTIVSMAPDQVSMHAPSSKIVLKNY